MTETPPPPADETTPSGDRWFHPMPPDEHAALHGVPEPAPEPPAAEPQPPSTPAEPVVPPRDRATALADLAADALPVGIVLAFFAIAAFIVPTMTQVATTDDWGYTRSVEILLDEGTLKVFPVVAATAVGQILWGALFGSVFGMSLGMMRVSTVVMVALGAVALYAILRQLGVSRGRGALGMAAWLFNPLTFSLAFSFMTDAHFASAMLIAVALYLRGLRPGREDWRWVLAGSAAAAFAFLIRQQGALIPLAVGVYLLLAGRLRLRDLRLLLAVVAVPVATVITYYAWLRWLNDVPDVQQHFLDEIRDAGWDGAWLLARRIPIYVAFYAGLLLIPIIAAIAPWRRRAAALRPMPPWALYACAGWTIFILAALYLAGRRGQQMPFAPQFVGLGGIGPPDVLGSRPRLVETGSWATTALTVAAAAGAIALGIVILRRLDWPHSPERAGFWLVATVGLWQLAGILPPSWHYLNRGVTLDRYLLPVIPLAIVALLWALRDVDLMQPVAWALLAIVAAFSVAGTRDYLVFLDNVWGMAEYANANGIENDRLDAGSAWDGYHLYTVMLDENVTKSRSPTGSPWWVYFYAKPTDSSYIVATRPDVRAGYVVVTSAQYDQWLGDEAVRVYLLRRWYLPFPMTGRGETVQPGIVLPGHQPGPVTTPVASPVPATPVSLATPAP